MGNSRTQEIDNERRSRATALLGGVRAGLPPLDLLAGCGCTLFALYARFEGVVPPEHFRAVVWGLPVLLACRLMAACLFRLYDFRHKLSLADHVFAGAGAAVAGVAVGYVVLAGLQFYYVPTGRVSRLVVLLDLCLLTAWFACSRGLALVWLRTRGYRIRVALAGTLDACRRLARELREHAPSPISVIGVFAMEPEAAGDDVIGSWKDLEAQLEALGVDTVILAGTEPAQRDLCALLATCDRTGREVYSFPELEAPLLSRSELTSLGGIPLVALRPAFPSSPYRVVKRAMDVAAAGAGLVLLSPALLAAALAVRLTSAGPVLYSQERVGLNGAMFRIRKFRTMVVGAEDDTGPTMATRNDPRVTPLGRAFRRWRVDEWPQLWNVLRGEMSLVGPRPERREFVEQFVAENPLYGRRTLVKPGLTGLAQVGGRYDSDYADKLRYDLVYVNSVSFALDVKLLLATVRIVLTGKGAQ